MATPLPPQCEDASPVSPSEENRELLALLDASDEYVPNLRAALQTTPWYELSPRRRAVLAHMYASQYGKRGTDRYEQARSQYTI